MRKFFAWALVLAVGLSIWASLGTTDTAWFTKQLYVRTSTTAGGADGFLDSANVSLGAAGTLDTTTSFEPAPVIGFADSLQLIVVGLGFEAALASGESVYVGIEGSADQGATWRTINGAAIGFQGIKTAASVTNVANGIVSFNGATVGTTNVTGASTVGSTVYGNFMGWPLLRLKIYQDRSGAITQSNNITGIWVSFPKAYASGTALGG